MSLSSFKGNKDAEKGLQSGILSVKKCNYFFTGP